MQLTKQQIKTFQNKIYEYYKNHGRTFSWRETTNPYHIFVSEVMLQQTQTTRVAKKYELFITKFPNIQTLAKAPFFEVLKAWQGLGYNRRAKFLHQSAQIIYAKHDGYIPNDTIFLETLPGIGTATAASIAAFAFNSPTIFVETNIRVVLIHFFLPHKTEKISDKELLSLSAQTLDNSSPRIWYYAITDYGAMLKSQGINPIQKTKAYTKQSKFIGSDRQIRGAIIKALVTHKKLPAIKLYKIIQEKLDAKSERIEKIIENLISEKFIKQTSDNTLHIF